MERISQNLSFIWADDIVFEILTWLPVKSLMRFKCVSKAWNALIRHDSNFIKFHIARSHARPSAAHILFELLILPPDPPTTHDELEEFSLQLVLHHYPDTNNNNISRVIPQSGVHYYPDTNNNNISRVIPQSDIHRYPDIRFKIVICSNHCNGLVCFHRNRYRVYLHNVSTRESKPLPFPLVDCFRHASKLFLGFDTVMEKYKLLRLDYNEGRPKIEILTLGTNSWREIKSIPALPHPGRYHMYNDCFFLNGLLYWRTTLDYFDFVEEKFGIFSLSKDTKIMKPTLLWEKLVQNSLLGGRYERRHFISDEVNDIFMKYYSDDSNSVKLGTLQLEKEICDQRPDVLATASLIDAPTSLVFPLHFLLTNISIFVENIIPLSFTEV